jgi:hypothetical protein
VQTTHSFWKHATNLMKLTQKLQQLNTIHAKLNECLTATARTTQKQLAIPHETD